MVSLSFNQEIIYGANEHVIRVPVRVVSPAAPVPFVFQAFLDTGASPTTFDSLRAPNFGIHDYRTGPPMTFTSANGAKTTGYLHHVRIEVWGREFALEAAFVDGFPNLLGMRGFLEQVTFAVNHGARRYYV